MGVGGRPARGGESAGLQCTFLDGRREVGECVCECGRGPAWRTQNAVKAGKGRQGSQAKRNRTIRTQIVPALFLSAVPKSQRDEGHGDSGTGHTPGEQPPDTSEWRFRPALLGTRALSRETDTSQAMARQTWQNQLLHTEQNRTEQTYGQSCELPGCTETCRLESE